MMRGVDTVDNEFEVGFDQRFETNWHRAELVGRFVMAAFVLSAGFELLGRGPYSHRTVQSADGALRVDYEPIARHSTTTTVTVHIQNGTGSDQPVRLSLPQQAIEPMGFQHAVPPADGATINDAGIRLNFTEQPHQKNALVRLMLKPTAVGLVPMRISDGQEDVRWTMLVVP